jgi:hypothetical protein
MSRAGGDQGTGPDIPGCDEDAPGASVDWHSLPGRTRSLVVDMKVEVVVVPVSDVDRATGQGEAGGA